MSDYFGSQNVGDTTSLPTGGRRGNDGFGTTSVSSVGSKPGLIEEDYRDDLRMPDAGTLFRRMRDRDQRRMTLALVCACLTVIVTLSFVVPMFAQGVGGTAVAKRGTNTKVREGEVEVGLYVRATGLDGNGSRIPLRISGHKPDGSSTEDACFISYTGEGLVLAPGTFEVRVAESPIAGDGTMYRLPEENLQIEVSESLEVFFPTGIDTIRLEKLPASEMSDDVIESAKSWILKDPECRDNADDYVRKAQRKRDEELAREKERAEQAERVAAQEREAIENPDLHVDQNENKNNDTSETSNRDSNEGRDSSGGSSEDKSGGSSTTGGDDKGSSSTDSTPSDSGSGNTPSTDPTPTEPTEPVEPSTPEPSTPEPTPSEPVEPAASETSGGDSGTQPAAESGTTTEAGS